MLGQSGLAQWASIPYSYLAMTKPSPYSEESVRPEICVSERKYLFVYPFEKKREWYTLPIEERQRIMNDPHRGRPHATRRSRSTPPTPSASTTRSSSSRFEGDDPGEFLDLVQELRGTESSSYTLRDTPIFTCVAMSLGKALDALDGTAATAAVPAGAGLD